ncbi:MAG: AI-2E family transporter [Sphingobacteriales bacterium]|nr:MAG: AI-2E family transporter [Sphingobacteriales bacterium]
MDNNSPIKLPQYAKLAQIIIGLVAFFYVLFIGQAIIVPLVFSTIFAILLNPVVNFLVRHKFNRVLAIMLVLLLALVLIFALLFFLGSQATLFSDAIPQMKQKFAALFHDIFGWITKTFNIPQTKINEFINSTKSKGLANGGSVIGQTLGTIGGVFVLIFLLPVYIFMILFYKPLLLEFISQLFRRNNQDVVAEVLQETKSLIQNYLIGLLLEMVIVAALNATGLLIIGLDYAILIGIIGAMLNVIPYIGGLIAIAIPMLLALATKTPLDALWVLLIYIAVQFIDNNFIVPKIVASKVKINALVSIVVVLIGGALWGVAGMFLSIPLTAIIKVIFDRVEPLKPFGFLLGDDQPGDNNTTPTFKNPIRIKRKPNAL